MEDLSHCRVLLVDDIKDNIKILTEALKDSYKVSFSLDGESALKLVPHIKPDLILLDIMMPGVDGFEVCRRLKSSPATRDIPILFITAMDDAKSKAAGFEAGAVDYITKPFQIGEVKARVRTHLNLRVAHNALEKQRDRMKQSLDLAMEVQQSLLPKVDPRIEGWDIAGLSIYCDETGGDYFDYINVSDQRPDRIGVVVGDVSEHGIPSALLMTTARAFLRQRSSMSGEPNSIIRDVNWQITRDVKDSGRFMTLFYCEIDTMKRKVFWSNAGHEPALLFDHESGGFEELGGGGPALGLMPDFEYEQHERDLMPGQIAIIGTDGIWETRNRRGEMFGKERLLEVIREHRNKSSRDLIGEALMAVDRFRLPREREDDATLVVIKAEV